MSYIPLYSNTCKGANQNPFDPTNWTATSGGMPPSLAIVSEQLVGGNSGGFSFGKNYYSGAEDLTPDSFCQFQIASIPSNGGSSDITFSVRSVAGGNYTSGYNAVLVGGPSLFVNNPSGDTIIFSSLSKVSVGDVFILQAVGSLVTIYQNGTSIGSATDSTTDRDGTVYLEIGWTATQSDTGVVNLAIGSVVTTYSVSGNTRVGGATLNYSGTESGSTVADGSGNFNLSLPNGTYTLTPVLAGFTFSPTSQNETVSGADISGVNFSASATGIVPTATLNSKSTYRPRPVQLFGALPNGDIAGISVDENGNLCVGNSGSINEIDVLGDLSEALPCMLYGPTAGSTVPGSTLLVAATCDQYANLLTSQASPASSGDPNTTVDTPGACSTGVTPVQLFGRDGSGNLIGVCASTAGALGNTLSPIENVSPGGAGGIDELSTGGDGELPIPIVLCARVAPGFSNSGQIVPIALDSSGALCISGAAGASTSLPTIVFPNGVCRLIQAYARTSDGVLTSIPLTVGGLWYLN